MKRVATRPSDGLQVKRPLGAGLAKVASKRPRATANGHAFIRGTAQRLREEIFLLETLMDTIPDSIYFKDRDSRFTRVNRHTAAKFGLRDPVEALGKTDFDFFTREHAEQAFDDEQEIIRSGRPVIGLEERETLPDGGIRWVSTTKMPLRDSEGRIIGTFGISRDITDKKLAEQRLERQAFFDELTGLPNRALFLDRLAHLFHRIKRAKERFLFAVVFLDLDRFKGINDTLGHHAGDRLLVQLARRLETCIRPSDTLARLGGDEFTLLLEEIQTEADATRVATRIQRSLASPFDIDGMEVFATASIGIALSSSGYDGPAEMLRDADTAMYRAKANGRARYEVFDDEMHMRARTTLQLETELRRAVERKEWTVHYQPIVDLGSRRLLGFEALVRWVHPERGIIMPDTFIPVAEETGLIGAIGHWVLTEACRQTGQWQRKYRREPPLTISVNVSTRQLTHGDLVHQVSEVLRETGVDPRALMLEITESAMIQNLKTGAGVIQRLHDMAVRLHVDDFGTGYSSLSYLHDFPVDAVKVDRSFISRMHTGERQGEIVRTIVAMAQNMGMGVTAEGVETAEQAETLRALKCESAQGFFFARPMPAAEAERLLAEDLALA